MFNPKSTRVLLRLKDKNRHAMHARVIFLVSVDYLNIVSDVYIFITGKKSINTEMNENVEITHT